MALVTCLLQTPGDLTPDELRRLELYRPQRIAAAADAMIEKLGGRGNEAKRARLTRISQYAKSLQTEFEPEAKDFIPSSFVLAEISAARHALDAEPPGHVPPPETWGGARGDAPLPLDRELSLLSDDAPLEPERSADYSSPSTAPAPPWGPRPGDQPSVSAGAPAPPTLAEVPAPPTLAEVPAAPTLVELPSAPAPLTTPEASAAPHEPMSYEVPSHEPVRDEPVLYEPVSYEPVGYEEGRHEPVRYEPIEVQHSVEWEEPLASHQSGVETLQIEIRRAEDVLALAERERVDALAFLEPPELERILSLTEERDIKRGVIDSLVHLGTPDALEVLEGTLEDPDPEIQLYALSAAEQLLASG